MTVELQIPFVNNQFACEFMDYLKENGCDSKMGIGVRQNVMVVRYQGSVAAIEALYRSVETIGDEDFAREKKMRAVKKGRAWLAEIKAGIAEIYEKCELGVEYDEYEDILKQFFGVDLKVMTSSEYADSEDPEKRKQVNDMIAKKSSVSQSLGVLSGNGCAIWDCQNRKVTIISPCPSFEKLNLRSRKGEGLFDCFLPEELENAGIRIEQDQQEIDIISIVVPEPAFVRMDVEKIIQDFTEYMDGDPNLEETLRFYSILIGCVRNTVTNSGITVEELKERMLGVIRESGISFDDACSDEARSEEANMFVQLILDNMSQAGCIVCEDGKVKPGK